MKKSLIVIDMQNDFIDGSLGTPEAQAIVDEVVEEINEKKKEGYEIIATQDTHTENYLNTLEGKKLPVEHTIKGTKGWEINSKIKEALGDEAIIFEKPTFGSEKLVEYLKENPSDKIEILGVCTDICVTSNAILLRAAFPDTPISVKQSCVAGVNPELNDAALLTMQSCQVDIV